MTVYRAPTERPEPRGPSLGEAPRARLRVLWWLARRYSWKVYATGAVAFFHLPVFVITRNWMQLVGLLIWGVAVTMRLSLETQTLLMELRDRRLRHFNKANRMRPGNDSRGKDLP